MRIVAVGAANHETSAGQQRPNCSVIEKAVRTGENGPEESGWESGIQVEQEMGRVECVRRGAAGVDARGGGHPRAGGFVSGQAQPGERSSSWSRSRPVAISRLEQGAASIEAMTATAKRGWIAEPMNMVHAHSPPFQLRKKLDLPANPVQLARSKGVNVARARVER
jgi:hypothetical protein